MLNRYIDFEGVDSFGNIVRLSDFKGKKVVLYFYPKDNTPGCSKQACNYNENLDFFKDNNIEVIGVSKDSLSSHQKFISKYDLKFTLISDEDLKIIKDFDVYKEKMNYGKKYLGVVRTTVIIDEDGKIIYYDDKVKAASDATKVREFLSCK